ncbi:MAG: tetratricopeptide repeat protein [Pyrinomonadaceae bacterium]
MSRPVFRLLIVSIVLAFAAAPAFAQQITGQVRYADGNQPAFNIPVECQGTNCNGTTYTDRQGKFVWRFGGGAGGISGGTGQYTITVSAPGYRTETRSVTLLDVAQSEYMFFTLKRDPKAGDATGAPGVVTAPVVIDPKVPAPAREEYEKALKESDAGKPDKAIPHLEKAVSLYPDFLQAQLLLGTAYMDNKQWDKAEATLKRAVALDPKKSEGFFALGELYYQQKKYPDAEKALVMGLQIQENAWQGHYTLGRVYMDAKAFDKAAPHMDKANQIRPDFAEGHFLAGNIYLKLNNGEAALKELEEYLRLAPKGKLAPQVQNTVTKLKEILKK